MMLIMLSMAVLTIHISPLLANGSEWWMEALGTGLFLTIVFLAFVISRMPKNKERSRNGLPSILWLPIFAIWMDIYLIVCLPYYSWVVFFIWMLLGWYSFMGLLNNLKLINFMLF